MLDPPLVLVACPLQGALGMSGESGPGATGYEGAVFSSDDPEYKSGNKATGGHAWTPWNTFAMCHCAHCRRAVRHLWLVLCWVCAQC